MLTGYKACYSTEETKWSFVHLKTETATTSRDPDKMEEPTDIQGTATVGSIPKLNPRLKDPRSNDQAIEDAGGSSEETLLDGHGPAALLTLVKP